MVSTQDALSSQDGPKKIMMETFKSFFFLQHFALVEILVSIVKSLEDAGGIFECFEFGSHRSAEC